MTILDCTLSFEKLGLSPEMAKFLEDVVTPDKLCACTTPQLMERLRTKGSIYFQLCHIIRQLADAGHRLADDERELGDMLEQLPWSQETIGAYACLRRRGYVCISSVVSRDAVQLHTLMRGTEAYLQAVQVIVTSGRHLAVLRSNLKLVEMDSIIVAQFRQIGIDPNVTTVGDLTQSTIRQAAVATASSMKIRPPGWAKKRRQDIVKRLAVHYFTTLPE